MIEYQLNKATEAEIAKCLRRGSADFVPPLHSRVEISGYAKKIACKAMRFEAWSDGSLIGLVAAYCNDTEARLAFVTSVNVLREWTGKGIAANLMKHCVKHAQDLGVRQISLEVASDNLPAIKLYEKSGFVFNKANPPFITMNLYLKSGKENE